MFSSEYCEIFKNNYFEENLQTAAFASVFDKNKRYFCGSKTLHKIDLKNWWISQVFLSKLCVMAPVSLIREATLFIFKDPSVWLLPKWISIIKSRYRWINPKNPTHLKTFCDGLDFGSLPDPRRYSCSVFGPLQEKTWKKRKKRNVTKTSVLDIFSGLTSVLDIFSMPLSLNLLSN